MIRSVVVVCTELSRERATLRKGLRVARGIAAEADAYDVTVVFTGDAVDAVRDAGSTAFDVRRSIAEFVEAGGVPMVDAAAVVGEDLEGEDLEGELVIESRRSIERLVSEADHVLDF